MLIHVGILKEKRNTGEEQKGEVFETREAGNESRAL
jgi:hypothetical protein